jgi:hypothetical protein
MPREDVPEATARREVLRRSPKHGFELARGEVELIEAQESARQRDARGVVLGMVSESCPGYADRLLKAARPAVFFGELGEGEGRGIPVDPASQFLEA